MQITSAEIYCFRSLAILNLLYYSSHVKYNFSSHAFLWRYTYYSHRSNTNLLKLFTNVIRIHSRDTLLNVQNMNFRCVVLWYVYAPQKSEKKLIHSASMRSGFIEIKFYWIRFYRKQWYVVYLLMLSSGLHYSLNLQRLYCVIEMWFRKVTIVLKSIHASDCDPFNGNRKLYSHTTFISFCFIHVNNVLTGCHSSKCKVHTLTKIKHRDKILV